MDLQRCQVLPPLLDIIPEARLNLVIYHLRKDEAAEVREPKGGCSAGWYILKGVVFAALGQKTGGGLDLGGSRDHLKMAQQLFQLVGASASECDTIPGRQCMASCFFLLRQFEDVLVYLKSIKQYFTNDDDFNWNYGASAQSTLSDEVLHLNCIACAAAGDYKEAKEAKLPPGVSVSQLCASCLFCYLSWLARCYIMSNEPSLAWEAYVRMDTSNESFNLLHLIANDCYKMGHFYYACKARGWLGGLMLSPWRLWGEATAGSPAETAERCQAFDVLERLDPDPEFWEGAEGCSRGVHGPA
eukprot:Skav233341  [mRNA]  locus=scaffold394:148325:153487:+ [translate_table: standard]